jgi:microcompartment protein CcmL/EutN
MKSFLLALGLFAAVPAFAGECNLGKNNYGQFTVNIDGSAMETKNSMEEAIASLAELRNAGLCDANSSSICKMGKNNYGQFTVNLNGSAIETKNSMNEAIESLAKLENTGLCDSGAQSLCTLGKNNYGQFTVVVSGSTMETKNNMDEAIDSLGKLRDAGLCGQAAGHLSCKMRNTGSGVAVYIDSGATLIDTYRNEKTARIVMQALVRAHACGR